VADEGDGSALTILWIVSLICTAGLLIAMLAAGGSNEELAALLGGVGFAVGALLATTYQMSRNRKRAVPRPEAVNALMDRMQMLEQEQQRMAELEERVDFAERMLARAQDEALLPHARHGDGRGS
jgi:hypothetical protein